MQMTWYSIPGHFGWGLKGGFHDSVHCINQNTFLLPLHAVASTKARRFNSIVNEPMKSD